MVFNNKKGDERYLSPWMFLIWALIAVSVIIGVIMFYSVQADVRLTESQLFATRILDCFSSNFNYSEISANGFDIYSKCNLNKQVIEGNNLYYFNLSIKDLSSAKYVTSLIKGVGTFETGCRYQQDKKESQTNFAQCSFRTIQVLDSDLNKYYLLEVVTASNQK